MSDNGLSIGQPIYRKSFFTSVTLAAALAVLLLPLLTIVPGTLIEPALASETHSELERIYEDAEYSRKQSCCTRIEAYLKKHPDNADVICMKARYLLLDEHYSEAEALYRRAIQLAPKSSRAWAGLSFCLLNKKDIKGGYDAALKADQLYKLDPIYVTPDVGIIKNLMILSSKNGHYEDVNKYQFRVREYEAVNRARAYREQGTLDKSIETLNKVIQVDPKCTYAYLLRGVSFNNQSQHQQAIKDMDTVIAQQPDMSTAYYIRGDSYFDLGNKAKAVESWKQIFKLKPSSLPDLVAFCFVAMTGRFREHFEPNDEVIVNKADVYYLCGVAESDMKQYEAAAKDYSQCIALDGKEYRAYFERAIMNEHLNREPLVMADLDTAIKINGKFVEAILERAKIYEKKHDNARALADYGKVIAINPSDFGSYILRADLAARIKSYNQAISDYTQAIKLSPSDDDPLVGRAKVYTTLGRYDEALADYRKAARLNPQDKAVVLDAIGKVEKLKKGPNVSVR